MLDIYVKRTALQYEFASLYICDAGLNPAHGDLVIDTLPVVIARESASGIYLGIAKTNLNAALHGGLSLSSIIFRYFSANLPLCAPFYMTANMKIMAEISMNM